MDKPKRKTGKKLTFLKDGKPAFQVKSLGHRYEVKRIYETDKTKSYVKAKFLIDNNGKVTIYDSDGHYTKEFIFQESDPHVLYKVGTMLREIGSFGIHQNKVNAKKDEAHKKDSEGSE